ncbi:hypothetical protein STEG23_019785, partial [Scotinomys teguina]
GPQIEIKSPLPAILSHQPTIHLLPLRQLRAMAMILMLESGPQEMRLLPYAAPRKSVESINQSPSLKRRNRHKLTSDGRPSPFNWTSNRAKASEQGAKCRSSASKLATQKRAKPTAWSWGLPASETGDPTSYPVKLERKTSAGKLRGVIETTGKLLVTLYPAKHLQFLAANGRREPHQSLSSAWPEPCAVEWAVWTALSTYYVLSNYSVPRPMLGGEEERADPYPHEVHKSRLRRLACLLIEKKSIDNEPAASPSFPVDMPVQSSPGSQEHKSHVIPKWLALAPALIPELGCYQDHSRLLQKRDGPVQDLETGLWVSGPKLFKIITDSCFLDAAVTTIAAAASADDDINSTT